MEPQTYIEFDSNLEMAKFEEWVGREYARDWLALAIAEEWVNRPFAQNAIMVENQPPYPVPPDAYVGPPAEPPPEAWTYYYSRALPKAGDGGVFRLYDAIIGFATQEQTLSDNSAYSYDIVANQKTAEQLSPAGQAALPVE